MSDTKCPNCGGPASQPIGEIYCQRECKKKWWDGIVEQYAKIGADEDSLWASSIPWGERILDAGFVYAPYIPFHIDKMSKETGGVHPSQNFEAYVREKIVSGLGIPKEKL